MQELKFSSQEIGVRKLTSNGFTVQKVRDRPCLQITPVNPLPGYPHWIGPLPAAEIGESGRIYWLNAGREGMVKVQDKIREIVASCERNETIPAYLGGTAQHFAESWNSAQPDYDMGKIY